MKNISIILTLFISLTVFAQDPYLQKSDPKLEQSAIELTKQYNAELVMTGEQQLLFQQKVEEFLIRAEKIKNDYEGRKKLDLLYELQLQETAEMNDIITHIQMQLYKKIRPKIQPLETVESEAK